LEIQPDELFNINSTRYLPIFAIHRSGNFTQDKVKELFGDLKTGLKAKKLIIILGYVFAGVLILSSAFFGYKVYSQKKEDQEERPDEEESLVDKKKKQPHLLIQGSEYKSEFKSDFKSGETQNKESEN